jgi:molybdopterin molybdotransferase
MSAMNLRDVLVEDALARMLALAVRLASEPVLLDDALGRTLAEPVTATRDQPPFPASAMDGWAVRSADTGPLRAVGESAAGHAYAGRLKPGETVRIFTGAPVPDGADAILIQENASLSDGQLTLNQRVEPGLFVRRAGGDFRAGDLLLEPGVRLDPWRLALAAAAGKPNLLCAARPRVAILSTGDEIVLPGAAPGPYQIFNSGGPALAAMVRRWGGEPILLSPAVDSAEVIAQAVADQACDVVVTVGGASVGDHDLVKPALGRLGLSLVFETLKMRPGKPTWFGTLTDGRRVLGLPGNPASAMACAELFLHPLLSAMQGGDPAVRLTLAKLAKPLAANGPREHWMRSAVSNEAGVLSATPLRDQDSSLVTVFAQAEALLRRLPDAPAAEAGEVVELLVLDRL